MLSYEIQILNVSSALVLYMAQYSSKNSQVTFEHQMWCVWEWKQDNEAFEIVSYLFKSSVLFILLTLSIDIKLTKQSFTKSTISTVTYMLFSTQLYAQSRNQQSNLSNAPCSSNFLQFLYSDWTKIRCRSQKVW